MDRCDTSNISLIEIWTKRSTSKQRVRSEIRRLNFRRKYEKFELPDLESFGELHDQTNFERLKIEHVYYLDYVNG